MTLPQAFWALNIWSSDAKTGLLAGPITRITRATRDRQLNQQYSYEIDVVLEDKATGGPNTINKGNYLELSCGATMPQTLWIAGYVQKISVAEGVPGTFTIQCDSSSYFLHSFRSLQQTMKYGPKAAGSVIYQNVMDAINGVSNADGQRGILPYGLWHANFLDAYSTALGTSTTGADVTAGNTAVGLSGGYVPTNGTNQNKVVVLSDATSSDSYQLINVNSPTNISIRPPAWRNYTTPSVKYYSYKFPGTGDSWETDFETSWNNLNDFAGMYPPMFIAERTGSTAHSGVLDIGNLGLATAAPDFWGGVALATQQGRNSTAYSYLPDVAAAQASGYTVIEAASYSTDLTGMYNLFWLLGSGEGTKLVTIRSRVGGAPPGNGWSLWQPYGAGIGRDYYTKTASRTTYDGHTYEYVASHDPQGYRFGIVDRTNVTAYGVQEYTLEKKTITDAAWLESAGIGALQMAADPIPQWQFGLSFPLNSASQVPSLPNPGEAVTVHYSGEVHDSIEIDSNTLSATYGQWVGNGAYTYLSWPGPWATTTEKQNKNKRVVEVQDEWTPDHGFNATVTTGRGKWHSHHAQAAIGRQMHSGSQEKKRKHRFVKHPFHHIPWLFSQAPDAWEDIPNEALQLEQTGAIVVSDAVDDKFFSDHHYVAFTVTGIGSGTELRFWFGKPPDQTLQNASASGPYGVLRLCFGSGPQTGFYSTTNGTALTAHGTNHKSPHCDVNGHLGTSGTFRVIIHYHGASTGTGGEYRAQIEHADAHGIMYAADVATWRDLAVALSGTGAIGWQLVAGSNVTISQVHCSSRQHDHSPPKGGTKRSGAHPTNTTSKRHKGKSPAQGGGGKGLYQTE